MEFHQPFKMNQPYNTFQQPKADDQIDQVGAGIAGAFGPWWGALAQAGTEGSKRLRGDSMNVNKNMASYETDPFKHVKSLKAGFKDPKRFLETIPIYGTVAAGKRMKQEAMNAQEAEKRERAKIDGTRSSAFYEMENLRLGGGEGAFSLSAINP